MLSVTVPTMISMELQRDVPQYIAIPWLMTWVMARTVSVVREGERKKERRGRGRQGSGPAWGLSAETRRRREGCGDVLQAVYSLALKLRLRLEAPGEEKKELPSNTWFGNGFPQLWTGHTGSLRDGQ